MGKKIFVGNLSFDTTENDLRDMLGAFGAVSEVNLIMDRATGQICSELSLKDLLRGRGRSLERENERLKLFNYVPFEQRGHN